MPIEVVVPVRRTRLQIQPDRPLLRLPADSTVGLIANGKYGSEKLLDHVGRELVASGLVSKYFVWKKPTASRAITEVERDRMLARSHLVISGVGD